MSNDAVNLIYAEIEAERQNAQSKGNASNDLLWGHNDWISFATAYLGRAASGVYRNARENQDYRTNMVKAAGILVAALLADEASNLGGHTEKTVRSA